MFMKILRDKKYVFVDPAFIVDHENSDRLGLNLELEFGRLFSKRLMAYIKPGAGVHGDKCIKYSIGTSKLDLDISLDRFYFF